MCFKLNNGRAYGIIGDTGTVSLIAELLAGAQIPSEGAVLINGFDLQKESAKAKAFLGYIPKSPALYRTLTPVEYLLFLADVRQIEYEQSIRRIGDLLSLSGLSHKRNVLISTLSAYEKKCLTVAQALLCNADILILNDPFSDTEGQDAERLCALIEEIAQGRTLIICSERTSYLRRICDTVYTADFRAISAKKPGEEGIG